MWVKILRDREGLNRNLEILETREKIPEINPFFKGKSENKNQFVAEMNVITTR